ncbi:MAG: CPBP family intramembrane metalloprotease [Actinobacteria bacterium]|nr:CPBP family intramembrane metalloprotease [Actinomycetota bacterium]
MSSSTEAVDVGEVKTGSSLGRQLFWYFGGLIAVYLIGMVAFWPPAGEQPDQMIFLVLMFAPTAGALLTWAVAKGSIQWGRPNWWLFAGLIPALAVLGVYLVGVLFGWDTVDPGLLRTALVGAPLAILGAAISAAGEEIGWRGFLWPTLRARFGFWRVSLIVGVIWWAYHVPLVIFGWYGSLEGLPAFTLAIAGFTLFVGVLTDRSKSLWPSVVAHAAWNGLVATSFAVTEGAVTFPAFSGSDQLMGEFGWLAAITTALLGFATALWHTRRR